MKQAFSGVASRPIPWRFRGCARNLFRGPEARSAESDFLVAKRPESQRAEGFWSCETREKEKLQAGELFREKVN